MHYLLDTYICIYIIRKKPAQVLQRLTALDIADVGISSITLAELEYGIEKSSRPDKNRSALNNFLAPLEILPFDDRAAEHYGKIRRFLGKKGTTIGAMDMLIAAHALSVKATMVSNNTREFARIPNLALENWV